VQTHRRLKAYISPEYDLNIYQFILFLYACFLECQVKAANVINCYYLHYLHFSRMTECHFTCRIKK